MAHSGCTYEGVAENFSQRGKTYPECDMGQGPQWAEQKRERKQVEH